MCKFLCTVILISISSTFERDMATRVAAPGELLGVDELEKKLIDLSEQVERKKEEVKSNFQQLHGLLAVRENFLLKKMDEVVTEPDRK